MRIGCMGAGTGRSRQPVRRRAGRTTVVDWLHPVWSSDQRWTRPGERWSIGYTRCGQVTSVARAGAGGGVGVTPSV